MDTASIKSVVLDVLREVQEISGEEYVNVSTRDKPLSMLTGFDSLKGVEATVMIEERLKCEIERDSLFVSVDGRRATTLEEICVHLSQISSLGTKEIA